MAFNLILSQNQLFSVSSEPQAYNGWIFNPSSPIEVSFFQGGTVPSDIDISTVIKNYIALQTGSAYDKFYVSASVISPVVNFQGQSNIELLGDIASASAPGYELTELNLEVINTIHFINLTLVAPGSFNSKIIFNVFGETALNELVFQEAITLDIVLNVYNPNTVHVSPGSYYFNHILEAALPDSKTMNIIVQGAFTIKCLGHYSLSGGNLVDTGIVGGHQTYSGSDSQTVSLSLTSNINNEPAGLYAAGIVLSAGTSDDVLLRVYVYIYEDDTLTISPTSLTFFAIKNILEAEPQTIIVTGPGDVTVAFPLWLEVITNSSLGHTEIIVKPILSANLAAGLYQDVVTISANGDDYSITVSHQVVENVQLGASLEDINFTNDHSTISNFYAPENFSLLLTLEARFFNYGQTLLNEVSLNYSLGFFNFKTSFFIGKTLRNIMKELLSLTSINLESFANTLLQDNTFFIRNYYNPAIVKLKASFIHDFNEGLNEEYTYENVKFLKGRKPKTQFSNTYILNYYREPLRVTPNSVALFNFYKEDSHSLRIYKNSVYEASKPHIIGVNNVFAYKHTFEAYSPGDVVEIRLYKDVQGSVEEEWYEDDANFIEQKYIVIPAGKESYHIGWEDEFGVLDVIEFTGSQTFQLGYQSNVIKNYEDFLETLRKTDSTKSRKLTSNTGFIFKQNVNRIDSILNSKRAWIISKESKAAIDLIPITKSIINEDSDQDLYEFEIEFEINFNNDFEINS